jgi:hypothetical protein
MDGLLTYLARGCGREAEFFGGVHHEVLGAVGLDLFPSAETSVNSPGQDLTGRSRTQNETSIAWNEETGTLCAAWNDSYHMAKYPGEGGSGFGRSVDGGRTFSDLGPIMIEKIGINIGDPSLVWRRADGKFYFMSLNGGLALFRSDDDCRSFRYIKQVAQIDDDKELMAVDNDPSSPYFGRLYVAWKDYDYAGEARIFLTHSSDGGLTWSAQKALSSTRQVQGAWPAVAPGGTVYVAWLRWLGSGYPDGDVAIELVRSTDGGATFATMTPPVSGRTGPRDPEASGSLQCGRPALKGNIRYFPIPAMAIDELGVIHVAYAYDPDATGVGDTSNVYYRRSLDGGQTWEPEVQVNDNDESLLPSDQFQPSMSVGNQGFVTVGYYSKQNSATNLELDYYARSSATRGANWQPSVRLSDKSSPVVFDSYLATCYHGDYDMQVQLPGEAIVLWADDRPVETIANANVYAQAIPASVDYLLVPSPSEAGVCLGEQASFVVSVLQFAGFDEAVTLAVEGLPTDYGQSVVPNPVFPGDVAEMSVATDGATTPQNGPLTVTGDSFPSGISRTTEVQLAVFEEAPSAPSQLEPAAGAVDLSLRPLLEWAPPPEGASAYTVEIDDDAGFQSIDYSAMTSGSNHTVALDLESNRRYFWRVRAENACGSSEAFATADFTTAPRPGDCPPNKRRVVRLREAFEAAPAGWTSGGLNDTWGPSTERKQTGTRSWFAQNLGYSSDQLLYTPALHLPQGEVPLTFAFWNYEAFDAKNSSPPYYCFDAAGLEISSDSGASWQPVPKEKILSDPYNGDVPYYPHPLFFQDVWCGHPLPWNRAAVDLSPWAGSAVSLRFRLGTDSAQAAEGWYIDDVELFSCSDALFADGFETGSLTEWSAERSGATTLSLAGSRPNEN